MILDSHMENDIPAVTTVRMVDGIELRISLDVGDILIYPALCSLIIIVLMLDSHMENDLSAVTTIRMVDNIKLRIS